MKDRFISRRFIAFGTALLLGLLLVSSLLVGMALAQESQPDRLDVEAVTGVSYWLILDTARPVEETLPPLLKILDTLKASGAIVEFDPTPQPSAPMAAAGVRVVIAGSERLNLLRTLPGVLDAVVTLPPPPPQPGGLGTLATTGEITGLVTDATSGSPLNGIPVQAYDAVSFASIGNDNTDVSGEYTIVGTAAYSQAKVVFNRWGNNAYFREWYDDKPFFSEATPIDLPDGGVVPNINAALERTGTISGTVTDQGGGPASIVYITVYRPDGSSIAQPTTDMSGLFTSQVPSGTYKLELFGNEYVSEWYQDKNSEESATLITVTAGATTPLTAQVTRTGAISGFITGESSGTGLSDVRVTAYDATGHTVANTNSNSEGKYRLTGLPGGNYRLHFKPHSLSYEAEYYNNKPTLAAADAAAVTLGATTGNINAALASATGRITGTITKNGGVPLAAGENLEIWLYGVADDDWLDYFYFSGNGFTTTYSFNVISGTYKVRFSPSSSDLANKWYNNKTTWSLADSVVVNNGATTPNINADLSIMTSTETGCITGVVTTGGGAPLEDAGVYVYKFGDNLTHGFNTTNLDGGYSICNLESGNYQVSFSYYPSATTWYNGQTSHTAATMVTVTTGITTPNINGSLSQLGGCLKGKMTDWGGNALPEAWFQIFEVSGNAIPIYYGYYNSSLSETGQVDEDGGFVACGLQSGDYIIAARNGWFNSYSESRVTAHVTAGQQTDVGAVKVGPHVYLPIIVRN